MIAYPLTFNTYASARGGAGQRWHSRAGESEVLCAVPKEFDGPGGGLSPEDLFGQALLNCFLATFQVMAEKSKLALEGVSASGTLTVDRDEQKRPVMKAFHFVVRLEGATDAERAKSLVEKAVRSGFILNSVRTEITYELELGNAR